MAVSAAPRAAGRRQPYARVPKPVRAWVEEQLGSPVAHTAEQVGGMSPGCATRLRCADGTRAFVKAVGPELNPLTPEMFRVETRVLEHLGSDPLWAGLICSYDEPDGWVALLLHDVEGRHPDLGDETDAKRVLGATDVLSDRLSGVGRGLGISTAKESLSRFHEMWPHLESLPTSVLPVWALARADEMRDRMQALLRHCSGDSLAHNDIRNDNLLVRPDGSVVFVDWGVARTGPCWLDPLVLLLEWAERPEFDRLVECNRHLASLGDHRDELVTTFLYLWGCWLAYRSRAAQDIGLPTIKAFRLHESARLLTGARRRLDLGS
jgi:serine/threonine protein kinase